MTGQPTGPQPEHSGKFEITTNREFTTRYLIENDLPKVLQDEIDGYMELDREEIEGELPYDVCDALFDVFMSLDDYPDRKLWNALKPVLIGIGYARHVTDEELNSTVCWNSNTGHESKGKEDFVYKGSKYQVRDPIACWPEEKHGDMRGWK